MTVSWTYRERLPRHGGRDGEFVFDSTEGERAVRFFERRLWIPAGDYAGQRYRLPPWQDKWLRALYGWRRIVPTRSSDAATTRARSLRRYRRALVAIPRGNLKSSLGSGIALKGLTGADRPLVPEVIGTGTDRRNAGKIFGYSMYSVRRDRQLRRRLQVFEGTKRIVLKGTEGKYEVIAADASHSHGDHPTVVMVDDLQAQPRPALLSVLRTSQINLEDSLMVMFMTANNEGKIGPGWEEWQLGLQLMDDPGLDAQYLSCMFFADPDDDLEDGAVLRRANPSLGVSIPETELRAQVSRAAARPSERAEILALHFNIWPDAAKQSWIASEQWSAITASVEEPQLRGRACYVGVSATSSTAVASVAYVFVPEDEERGAYEVVLDAFVPEGRVAQLEDEDRVSYRSWIAEGWLTTTPGMVIDEDAIVAAVERRVASGWVVQQVAWHPRGPISLARRLQDAGLVVAAVTPGRASMSPTMREFEKLVLARRLHHGGDRLLAWMMRGLRAKRSAEGDVWPDGEASTGNITGPLAALMALSRHIALTVQDQQGSQAWG